LADCDAAIVRPAVVTNQPWQTASFTNDVCHST
jgi:hypothetical protein